MSIVFDLAPLVIGVLLLFLGGRLFWFFVAALGFAAGIEYGMVFFPEASLTALLIVSLCLGIFSAVAAVGVSRVAVLSAGFVSGGYLALYLWGLHAADTMQSFLIFCAGGVLGAMVLAWCFSAALVVLSSLVGAALITGSVNLPERAAYVALVLLSAVGFWAQTRRRKRSAQEREQTRD